MTENAYTVIIVGAGPGGLAVAGALLDEGLPAEQMLVLDRGVVGQAWLDYPEDTHLLSTSVGKDDENMVAGVKTAEVFPNIPHPSHILYQKYLQHVVEKRDIPVRRDTTVEKVVFDQNDKQFYLYLRDDGVLSSKYVVWAAGMFSRPKEELDMEGCYIHYARLPYLDDINATEITVVGSANGASGVVIQLAQPERKIRLIVSREYKVPDPIDCLWKENMQLVKEMEMQGLVEIVEHFRVKRIYKDGDKYFLESEDGRKLDSPDRPIICTGFLPNIDPIKDLVTELCEEHETFLGMDDAHQSERQPGLYIAGVAGRKLHEDGGIASFRQFGPLIAKDIIKKLRT
jgi:putative flavoprotein involved in K+ transport